MFKLVVLVLFIGAAAASGIATLPAVAPVLPATRTIFPGVIGGIVPRYYGAAGNVIDGIDGLGLAYNNYDLNDGRVLGLGVGRFGYGVGGLGYGLGGLGYGLDGLGYGLGGLGYGLGGLGNGIGGVGLGRLGGLGLGGVGLV